MQEAEDILRGLVHDHDSPMPPTLKADVMDMLADILSITGPQAEATSWLERLHTLDVERYGRIHSDTMSSCKKLAFTYSKQRDYERASQFLSKTGRELKESSSQGSLEQLLDRLQQISGWLVKIKGMMIVAKTIELSPPAGTRSYEDIDLIEVL
jgi:hypothetical protein